MSQYKLKYLQQQLHHQDNEYRHLVDEMHYNGIDLNDDIYMLLYLLCVHENIDSVYDDIKKIITSYNIKNPLFSVFDDIINIHSDQIDIKQQLKFVPSDIKQQINSLQHDVLEKYSNIIEYQTLPDPDSDFITEVNSVDISPFIHKRQTRSLVLYFRRESFEECETTKHTIQMDYFEFVLICKIFHVLMTNDNNLLFDDIVVISREPGLYPHYIHQVVPNIKYKNCTGDEFFSTCYYQSNTVHFMTSSIVTTPGSIPVLANNTLLHSDFNNIDHVCLDLSYDLNNHDDWVQYQGELMTIQQAFEQSPFRKNQNILQIVSSTTRAYIQLAHKLNNQLK